MSVRFYRLACMGACMGILCSCAHIPGAQKDVPVEIPESYATIVDGVGYPDRWWTGFEDEQLNALVEEAVAGNLGLKQVKQRLEQAKAVALKAGAAHIPQVSIDCSAVRSKTPQMDAEGVKSLQSREEFGLNLSASYEIDLWGRVASSRRAAALDAQAARNNLDAAAMTLVAQIADIWYQIASLQERLSLLQSQVKNSKDQVRLLELRFNSGQVVVLDVLKQREQLAGMLVLVPRLEASLATTRHQLAVLLGRAPQATEDLVPVDWPEISAVPDVGVPSDLLQKRPDVRAALHQLQAADERVASALADRLPALRITASVGYASSDTADLFGDLLENIAAGLLAPIVDGGRRRAESMRADAAMRERLSAFGEVFLDAMREVEGALVNDAKQREVIDGQIEQHKAAVQTLQQANARYVRGLTDYLAVLSASVREGIAARALIAARREQLGYRIMLHRSLGGHWKRSDLEGDGSK